MKFANENTSSFMIQVKVVNSQVCLSKYKNDIGIDQTMLCAAARGKDSCQVGCSYLVSKIERNKICYSGITWLKYIHYLVTSHFIGQKVHRSDYRRHNKPNRQKNEYLQRLILLIPIFSTYHLLNLEFYQGRGLGLLCKNLRYGIQEDARQSAKHGAG